MLLGSCYFLSTSIANILGVSRWTIHRWAFDLEIPLLLLTYSPIQQVELQQIVQEELLFMPSCGERYVQRCTIKTWDVHLEIAGVRCLDHTGSNW